MNLSLHAMAIARALGRALLLDRSAFLPVAGGLLAAGVDLDRRAAGGPSSAGSVELSPE
jgi:hypothetical protein